MGHDPLRSKQCFGWDHVASWSEGRTRETRERGYDKFKCFELRRERAQDKQVFAYRPGDFIVIGSEPTAKDRVVFMLANEAAKHLKGSKPD